MFLEPFHVPVSLIILNPQQAGVLPTNQSRAKGSDVPDCWYCNTCSAERYATAEELRTRRAADAKRTARPTQSLDDNPPDEGEGTVCAPDQTLYLYDASGNCRGMCRPEDAPALLADHRRAGWTVRND